MHNHLKEEWLDPVRNYCDILKEALIEVTPATVPEALDAVSNVMAGIQLLKMIADIPTKLFVLKFELYCQGLLEIPVEERQQYVEKVKEESLNKEFVFILNVLNKIEELSKIDIMLSLFKAKINEKISDTQYRRLMIMTSNTLYHDICFLNQDIKSNNFEIDTDEQEGLLANGWIRPLGSALVGKKILEDRFLFAYNQIAKLFCTIVFQRNIAIESPHAIRGFQIEIQEGD